MGIAVVPPVNLGAVFHTEVNLYGYADDSTFAVVMLSPDNRVAVAESLNPDPSKVSMWCDLLGMKLNASKTLTIIFTRSHTLHNQSAGKLLVNCAEQVKHTRYIGSNF